MKKILQKSYFLCFFIYGSLKKINGKIHIML